MAILNMREIKLAADVYLPWKVRETDTESLFYLIMVE